MQLISCSESWRSWSERWKDFLWAANAIPFISRKSSKSDMCHRVEFGVSGFTRSNRFPRARNNLFWGASTSPLKSFFTYFAPETFLSQKLSIAKVIFLDFRDNQGSSVGGSHDLMASFKGAEARGSNATERKFHKQIQMNKTLESELKHDSPLQ